MSAKLMRIASATIVLAGLLGAACSSNGPECATGTTEKDGVCVAPVITISCGEGTVAKDGACVAEQAPTCDPACGPGFLCSPGLACVAAPLPAGWVCQVSAYDDGETCDCGCGAPDPDCADDARPVAGCPSGRCNADGATCVACEPQCEGRQCGTDGCGGSCGSCLEPGKRVCDDGTCTACVPNCDGRTCGPDGCGGSCGACERGQLCAAGVCAAPLPEASCAFRCGEVAPSGCSCAGDCSAQGTCCVDVIVCGCQPDCSGKTCGDDGCGGLCGYCADGERCGGGACVDDLCDPDPCGGNGTCDPRDGSCDCNDGLAGERCDRCAPGYTNYPRCIRDLCAGRQNACSGHGTCAPATGACACAAGFDGVDCSRCRDANATYPNCAN